MRINITGGPGAGKTTAAPYLCGQLKKRGIHIHLVDEHATVLALQGRAFTPTMQLQIMGIQLEREMQFLEHGVPHIITDSPLAHGAFHAAKYNSAEQARRMMEIIRCDIDLLHPFHFIFLERGSQPYNPVGRRQTEAEARAMDAEILDFLSRYYPPECISRIRADDEAALLAKALELVAA